MLATAEGRGLPCSAAMSRAAAEESFAAPRLVRRDRLNHGLQPWLRSCAAPRLKELNSYKVSIVKRPLYADAHATFFPWHLDGDGCSRIGGCSVALRSDYVRTYSELE